MGSPKILRQLGAEAAPKLDSETIRLIAERLRSIEFGAQVVIGKVVEITFGGEARYAIEVVERAGQCPLWVISGD